MVNFQFEPFDSQEALIKFQHLFSFKGFWKHLIVIFTHYFSGTFSDDIEKIMPARNEKKQIYIF